MFLTYDLKVYTGYIYITDILSDILSGIYSDILSGILSILTYFFVIVLACMLTFFLASILAFSLIWALSDFNRERQISLPTEIWRSRLRSGSAH